MQVKPVHFLGDSLKRLRGFPVDARHDAGYQLDRLQRGLQPSDAKPVPAIGKGVEEIRIWGESGTFRVIYTTRMVETVYVLHAFQKKTQAIARQDIEIVRSRLALLTRSP